MRRDVGRSVAAAACAFAITACGGGGGGGGGGGNSGGGGGATLSVTADKTALQFNGFVASLPKPQSINFTLVNASASGEYYGQIVPDVPGDFQASFTPTSATTAVVTVNWVRPEALSRSGSLTFRLCSDVNCAKVAWTQAIPYTANVYSIAMDGQSLASYEGVAAPPVSVAITPADTANQLAVTTGSGGAWLSASRASAASIAIGATGAGVTSGSYQGSVRIAIAGQADAPAISIPVSFTVGDGTIAPPGASADLRFGTTAAATAASATVAFRGTQAPAWTASSDQPWLVLTQASGTGTGQLKYQIEPGRTDNVVNWGSATARVKISAVGLSDVSFPVTLNKQLPEVYTAAPVVVRTGVANTVRISGRGLSQLANAGQIQVGNLGGITGSIASDTVATLTLPPLAAGRWSVSVSNAAGIAATTTTLGAAAAHTLAAATIETTGNKGSSVFDPTRQALFTVNATQNTLLRLTLANGQWQAASLPVEQIGDLALSPDRRTVYVSAGNATLLAVDPDTLQLRATHTLPAALQSDALLAGYWRPRSLAVTNDLRLWFAGTQWSPLRYFDMLGGSFATQPATGLLGGQFRYPQVFAPGDGSMLLIDQSLQEATNNYVYTPGSGTLAPSTRVPEAYQNVVYSEDGSRLLIDLTTLYHGKDFTPVGQLPQPAGVNMSAVLSPDGRRLYRLASINHDSLAVDHIDVYDATQPAAGKTDLTKLGEISVADQAADCSGPYCERTGSFIISPLGDALFWSGSTRVVVIPIPAPLASLQSAQPRLKPAATR
ncbi:MAG TPA: hypothetical protein VGE36_02120 [Roseateles sp.]